MPSVGKGDRPHEHIPRQAKSVWGIFDRKQGAPRSSAEFLVADPAILDAGVVRRSATLAYSLTGLVMGKAKPASIAVG